jgi:hypothetical protein
MLGPLQAGLLRPIIEEASVYFEASCNKNQSSPVPASSGCCC